MLSSNANYIVKSKHSVLFILKALTVTLISSTVLFFYQPEQLKILLSSFTSKIMLYFRRDAHLQLDISFLKNSEGSDV